MSTADAIATRAFQEVRGRQWVISPVVISEILLTSKDDRREDLIYFSQHLFHRELLPSPEEFLVKYLEAGCPMLEKPRPLVSTSSIAETWRDLCDIPDKTFVFDKAHVKAKAIALAGLVRDLHRITRNRPINLEKYARDVSLDLTLEKMVSAMPSVKSGAWLSDERRTLHKIGIFFALILICAELGPDPLPVVQFWRRIGIHGTGERMMYLLRHHEEIVYRGPIAIMAYMTQIQCASKYSRGAYWDSLHAMYLTYVTRFLAEDPHFIALQNAVEWHSNAFRIVRPSKMEWAVESRINILPESFLKA